MDKDMLKSYKFKPSDVIEGLNRYFAETKANRYRRVPLEIRNGVWTSNPDYRKDIVFTNSPPDQHTRSGHVCWKYYLICDPEEVVGVAINWLREDHDIFYTPGMNEPPIKDPDDIFCMENLKETKNFSVAIDGLQESRRDYIADLQKSLYDAKRRIAELEKSIAKKNSRIEGLEADMVLTNELVKEQRKFITKVAVLLETKDPYIEREYAHAIDVLSNIVKYPNRYRWLYLNLKEGMESMLQEAEEREE